MPVHTIHVTGTRGEVTPLMHARIDTDFFKAAFALARNTVITRYGPHARVPGTKFDGYPKQDNTKCRLLPFEFSATQVYAVEVGHQYMRFWAPGGQVMSVGTTPYEISSPFVEADLPYLHVRQSGDVLYIYSRGRHNVKLLKRLAETNWTIEDFKAQDGPYLPPNKTGTTLRPAARGSAVPTMTSNIAPSGAVSGGDGGSTAFWVFNTTRVGASYYATNNYEGSVAYTFPGSTTKVVDAYYVRSTSLMQFLNRTPSSWEFQGWTGVEWITLDNRSGENGWGASEVRYFEFLNETPYRAYRFLWYSVDGNTDSRSLIQELGFHERGENQTPFDLYASSTAGINNNTGFSVDDVGRSIRLLGSDGHWRWAEITNFVTTTQVKIRLFGQALPDLLSMSNWHLGAWSKKSGWPYTGIFYEDRHVLAGSNSDPIGVQMSRNADYDYFGTSQPIVDDDGITVKLTGGGLDAVNWLAESGSLLGGTASSLRSIGNRDNAQPLSSTNVRQRAEVRTGSHWSQPVIVENVTLFIDRLKKRLFEAGYSYEADGYIAREVSTLNEHLFASEVEQVVYVDAPHKTAICRRTDGKLIFFAYDREQKVAGGTLIDLGGVVEDIMVLPGTRFPDVWFVVNRTRGTGQKVRHIERLAEFWDSSRNSPPIYGACSYTLSDDNDFDTVTGLVALRNRVVGVWADGKDIGDYTVDNDGTVEFADAYYSVVIGERMPWKLQTLRLPQIGNQDGSGLGRKAKIVNAQIDLYESQGVKVGGLHGTDALRWDDEAEIDPSLAAPLLSGMYKMPVDDSFANDGVFVVEGDRMFPATVRAISLEVEGEP